MKEKVIIIGTGFGGLGAAARLAAQGYQVDIFEKLDKPGGRAYVFEINGFKFDGGPTVITAPFMFDDIFAAAGRKREDYVDFQASTRFTASSTTPESRSTTTTIESSSSTRSSKWNPTMRGLQALYGHHQRPSSRKASSSWPTSRSCRQRHAARGAGPDPPAVTQIGL
jgi:phytoene dehydrogenase-like protein